MLLKPPRPHTGPPIPLPATMPFVMTGALSSLEAHGVRHVLTESVDGGLAGAASRLLGTAGHALIVGALPFDRHAASHLILPEGTRWWSGSRVPGARRRALPVGQWRVTERPARAAYAAAVGRALECLADAGGRDGASMTKVVLGRTLELEAPASIDPAIVLDRLGLDAGATAFCVPLPPGLDGAARVLVGASPELLVERQGARVTSLPMAGSAPREADGGADRLAARALVASAKDQREHRVVVEHVLDCLAPYCRELQAPDVPVLKSTATMWHLATPVEGVLKGDVSALELAAALHPTPAVCGSPGRAARASIASLEPFDRGFFTGAVGWCDAAGDGRWMVAIRCAEISGPTARLFAGAGIVAGSDPEAEADETGAKFKTLLRALGIDAQGRPVAVDIGP